MALSPDIMELLVELAPIASAFVPGLNPLVIEKLGEKIGPRVQKLMERKKTDRNPLRHYHMMKELDKLSDREFRTITMNVLVDGRYEEVGGNFLDAFHIVGSETLPTKG